MHSLRTSVFSDCVLPSVLHSEKGRYRLMSHINPRPSVLYQTQVGNFVYSPEQKRTKECPLCTVRNARRIQIHRDEGDTGSSFASKKGRRKSIFWTAAKVRCRSPFPKGGALALESPQLYVRTSMINTGKETIAQQVFSWQRTRRLPVPRWVAQRAPVSCRTRGYSDSFPEEVLSGALLECRNVCSVPLRRRYIGEEDLTRGPTYYKDTSSKSVAKWTIRCFSNTSPSSSVSAVREASRMPSSAAETSRKKGAPSKPGLSSIAQTQKPGDEATTSVYLRLCAAEQRLKVSQAIAATQAAWKQKVRLKDWRAGQKGAFYDGPAWFKFWLKKKRPGARG